MRQGETPVPIPNTMVKPPAADDTVLETVWESRRLPDQKRNNPKGLSIWKKQNRSYVAGGNGGLAQLGEHLPCKQGVESSNLLVSIRSIKAAGSYLENRIQEKEERKTSQESQEEVEVRRDKEGKRSLPR